MTSISSDVISLLAVAISIISLGISSYLSIRSVRTQIRPVIVMLYEASTGWCIENVGNGPALNVIVSVKADRNLKWPDPVRVPPVAANGSFALEWLRRLDLRADSIGVYYEDFSGNQYSSVCTENLTTVSDGRAFPAWADNEVGRHWWQDPRKPTTPKEFQGDWKGSR
jgi:hypothetical protein